MSKLPLGIEKVKIIPFDSAIEDQIAFATYFETIYTGGLDEKRLPHMHFNFKDDDRCTMVYRGKESGAPESAIGIIRLLTDDGFKHSWVCAAVDEATHRLVKSAVSSRYYESSTHAETVHDYSFKTVSINSHLEDKRWWFSGNDAGVPEDVVGSIKWISTMWEDCHTPSEQWYWIAGPDDFIKGALGNADDASEDEGKSNPDAGELSEVDPSRETISRWFDNGVKSGDECMIIVTNASDKRSTPFYSMESDVWEVLQSLRSRPDAIVGEVYDLKADKEEQLDLHRVWSSRKDGNDQTVIDSFMDRKNSGDKQPYGIDFWIKKDGDAPKVGERFTLTSDDFEHMVLGGSIEFQFNGASVEIALEDIGYRKMLSHAFSKETKFGQKIVRSKE